MNENENLIRIIDKIQFLENVNKKYYEQKLSETEQKLLETKQKLSTYLRQLQYTKDYLNCINKIKNRTEDKIVNINTTVSKNNKVFKYIFIFLLVCVACFTAFKISDSYFKYDQSNSKSIQNLEKMIENLEIKE